MITLRNWNTAFSQNFYCCVDCIGSSFRSVFRTPFMVTHTIPLCLQILRRSYFASEALHVALYMFLLLLAVGEGGDRFLSHNELRPSVSPVLNPYPHNGVRVCVCVCVGTRPRCPHMHACAYAFVVSSLCLVYFSSPATLCFPSTTLAIPSQPTHRSRESVDQ